ncbi:MAG TPA: hypothetical protein PLS95_14805 [Thermoanaerobaculales bacterium]|nr:hypothetical protein [Thermoanaerobaculales bacterium]HQN95699.1 hypothetical protein [Thermoanaerobaculales bacterium]HQP43715.1 hypothetical protein [Thermoanaerobaculales bacterium]
MTTKHPYVSFVLPADLLFRLDDFRHDNRFKSRGAAIVWLLRFALDRDPKPGDQRPSAGLR